MVISILRSTFALLAWFAIWIPTTAFVLFVLLRGILRQRSQSAWQPTNGLVRGEG